MSAMWPFPKSSQSRVLVFIAMLLLLGSSLVPHKTMALTSYPNTRDSANLASSRQFVNLNQSLRGSRNNFADNIKSEWRINYLDVPLNIQETIGFAIDIWSRNFESRVPVIIEVSWEENSELNILGSARPRQLIRGFSNSPNPGLWYPIALANSLAGSDLDPKAADISLQLNSLQNWYLGIEGRPSADQFDLVTVVLHEVAHGLGFFSGVEYSERLGQGWIPRPTPFDALVKNEYGSQLLDSCQDPKQLGLIIRGDLIWSGPLAKDANGGLAPKLSGRTDFDDNSWFTHLDQASSSNLYPIELMSPNLQTGKVIHDPGPVIRAMLRDMVNLSENLRLGMPPSKPSGLFATPGDGYALLQFTPRPCEINRLPSEYEVTVYPGSRKIIIKSSESRLFRISNLQNGKSYSFTLIARNRFGDSPPTSTKRVRPSGQVKLNSVDSRAIVTVSVGGVHKNLPYIIFYDKREKALKFATSVGSDWRIRVLKRNVNVGRLAICKNSSSAAEELNFTFTDFKSRDLLLATLRNDKWSYETVDGNGSGIPTYNPLSNQSTSADVSDSNSCVNNGKNVHIYYRDKTNDFILAASNTFGTWTYELVDRRHNSNIQAKRNLEFGIDAILSGNQTILVYESVQKVNPFGVVTSKVIRIATRSTSYPEDWRYQEIVDPLPINSSAKLSASKSDSDIFLNWISRSSLEDSLLMEIRMRENGDLSDSRALPALGNGNPIDIFVVDETLIVFNCEERICLFDSRNNSNALIYTSYKPASSISLWKTSKMFTFTLNRSGKLSTIEVYPNI